ncbi:MAG TPA: ATP-binding protein [Verrucomicrobiae bacterium]|jgi:signal transduction histidine kinase|nr:ATP-binding protein [Verrucomicrobiae bacterium]
MRLKTKLVLAISSMVLALVAIFCYLYVSHLVRQRTAEAYDSADFVAKEIRESAREASQIDLSTTFVNENDPKQVEELLNEALRMDHGLNTLLQSVVGYSPTIFDAAIADVNGRAIVDTDPLAIGKQLPDREDFRKLRDGSFLEQIKVVFGEPGVYDVHLPIQREFQPFGDIRIGISTVFLKNEVQPQLRRALIFSIIAILVSLALAAVVSNIALRPLEAIGRRLDQMTSGVPDSTPEPDPRRTDEYSLVNTKIDRLGRQIRDVKEVFSALKENLDQIMGTLQDGLVLFTRDTRVVLVSASAERFIGRPRGEILGSVVEGVFNDETKLGRIVLDAFALHQGIPQREIELDNGRRIQIALDFIAERGERIGALLTMRDAESVRRIENEIELSRRLAAIGRLTSGVAHEVKNPINAIVVHLELLREKMRDIDPDASRHMDIIGREIHRLDRVVQVLVDFNRPVDLRLSDFDLRKLIEDVTLLASPEAARQGVRLETKLGNNSLPVRADADLIKQALLNVILNGVQAMNDGGVLNITARQQDSAATIEVRDEGGGIPPEVRDKVFNLYFTTKKTGSGIGLAMSYRVLQLHNGAIDFITEMGRGTTFRLLLPLADMKEKEPAAVITRG